MLIGSHKYFKEIHRTHTHTHTYKQQQQMFASNLRFIHILNVISIHILLCYQAFHICDAHMNNALSRQRNVNRWKDGSRECKRDGNVEK